MPTKGLFSIPVRKGLISSCAFLCVLTSLRVSLKNYVFLYLFVTFLVVVCMHGCVCRAIFVEVRE